MGSHPVVHFEVNAKDPTVLSAFYSKLFGWHVESMPDMGYEMVDPHAGKGIGGGFNKADDVTQATVFYVATPDLGATIAKLEKLGGKIVVPITEIPSVVTFAQFSDPSGNIVGLVLDDGSQENPGPSAGSNPEVGWFEIMSPDAKSLWGFYTELFGWEIKSSEGPMVYGEVNTGVDSSIGGGIGIAPDGSKAVTMYASVDDVQKYLDQATALGGKALFGPMDVSEHLAVGMFADPAGSTFGLFASKH